MKEKKPKPNIKWNQITLQKKWPGLVNRQRLSGRDVSFTDCHGVLYVLAFTKISETRVTFILLKCIKKPKSWLNLGLR